MKRLLILSILLLPIVAFSQKTYEYLSISQTTNLVAITQGTETYEFIDLKGRKPNDPWDFRLIFTKVEQYESKGWEVFSTNQHSVFMQNWGTAPILHFMLRRVKSE